MTSEPISRYIFREMEMWIVHILNVNRNNARFVYQYIEQRIVLVRLPLIRRSLQQVYLLLWMVCPVCRFRCHWLEYNNKEDLVQIQKKIKHNYLLHFYNTNKETSILILIQHYNLHMLIQIEICSTNTVFWAWHIH